MADEKKPKPDQQPSASAGAKGPQDKPASRGPGGPREGKPKSGGGGGKHKHSDAPEASAEPRVEPRLQTRFKAHVRKEMAEKLGITNPMAQPRLDKIVVNINMGRHIEGTKIRPEVKNTVLDTIVKVTGQKPIVLKAKKSVSNFKVREGLETAAMVTLRRDRMWHFLDRFINLACPRIKDFRGLKDNAFDKQGNYACGITEQGVFPEINMADVTFTHGMNISIGFRNSTPQLSKFILSELGFPFRKPDEDKPASKNKK